VSDRSYMKEHARGSFIADVSLLQHPSVLEGHRGEVSCRVAWIVSRSLPAAIPSTHQLPWCKDKLLFRLSAAKQTPAQLRAGVWEYVSVQAHEVFAITPRHGYGKPCSWDTG
jgi:hypothetical protein